MNLRILFVTTFVNCFKVLETVSSFRSLTADIEEFTASSARLNTEIKNLEAERTPHTKTGTPRLRLRGVLK